VPVRAVALVRPRRTLGDAQTSYRLTLSRPGGLSARILLLARLDLDRRQVLAFRATGHGLAVRRPREQLVDAVRPVGLRRTKSAAVALAARLEGVVPDDVVGALGEERLMAFYGARGAVMIAPPEDVAFLSVGTAPADDRSLRAALPGAFLRQLDAAGLTATQALQAVIDAVRKVLASGPMPRGETAMAVTRALGGPLTPPCRGRCPDPHVEDSLFRLAGVNGVMRFHKADDVLVAAETSDGRLRSALRGELVHRYLACYGPSTPGALAAWAGISDADARQSMEAIGRETVEVAVDGRKAGVLLQVDASGAAQSAVRGVRFLPPFDPYLLDRDRALLVPSRPAQKAVWRSSGNPGVVLVDADPVATWRTRKRAGRSSLALEPLDSASPVDPAKVEEEASRLTELLDAGGG
jgi:hypothetical protein